MIQGDRPVLLYACPGVPAAIWAPDFARVLPELEVRIWPETGDPAEIDYAFVWHPPAGLFPRLTRLRVIFSLGAGVEGLLADPELPPDIPLIRMVDPSLAQGMTEFVLMQVLHYHRRMPEVAANQRARLWEPLRPPVAQDRRVGILGFGELGAHCADALVRLSFDVAVWSRTRRPAPGVTGFAGRGELAAFLARSEILVCLLPLTPDTAGILDAAAFAAMPLAASSSMPGAAAISSRRICWRRSTRAGSPVRRSTCSASSRCRPTIPSGRMTASRWCRTSRR